MLRGARPHISTTLLLNADGELVKLGKAPATALCYVELGLEPIKSRVILSQMVTAGWRTAAAICRRRH